MGVYPFMFGAVKDFEPVAQEIIKVRNILRSWARTNSSKKDLKEPYDWDSYAKMYFPKAEELAKIAEEAEKAGEKEKASEYYL